MQIGGVLKKSFEDGAVKREKLFITSKIRCVFPYVYLASKSLTYYNLTWQVDLQLDYVDTYPVSNKFFEQKLIVLYSDSFQGT